MTEKTGSGGDIGGDTDPGRATDTRATPGGEPSATPPGVAAPTGAGEAAGLGVSRDPWPQALLVIASVVSIAGNVFSLVGVPWFVL